ncbi:MAG: glycosyltransferase family 2 protein [Armatimonadetes bacterium]|nr:glycosyltransferase family 2 protein [Armatimonadota bacterium]
MLSVIVLNCNKAGYSEMLLDSLLATTGVPIEFVLVDNGSQDRTGAMLAEFAPRAQAAGFDCRILTFAENIGAIRGRNEAMADARGEWFAFVDNDVVVRDRDWAQRLIARLGAEPDLGIVSPKILFPWEPYDIEFCGCEVTPSGRVIYRGRGDGRDDPRYADQVDCPCLISACIVFPRRLYDEFGGLDEVFSPVQYEDLDFCYRVRQAGWRCAVVPEVEMYHWEHTTTSGTGGINFSLVTLRNGRTFAKRWQAMLAADATQPDEAAKWREITRFGLEDVPHPPLRR